MEGYLLHSLHITPTPLSLCYLFLLPSSREDRTGGHDHQSSRIAFLVHHAALNPGTGRPGGPHYSSLHGHSWKHISNDYPHHPSFFRGRPRGGGRPRVHTTRCIRGSWARIAVGPNVNIWNPLVCEWSSADIFPFVSVARGKLVIETVLAQTCYFQYYFIRVSGNLWSI